MPTIFAAAAKHGTPYLDQRGRRVEKIGLNMQGQTILRRADGSGEESVDRNYVLTEVPADVDGPAIPLDGVVGKPRPVIEAAISDLTSDQLDELIEADTRMFVEVLVGNERKARLGRPVVTQSAAQAVVVDSFLSTEAEVEEDVARMEADSAEDRARAYREGQEAQAAGVALDTPTPLLNVDERGAWERGWIVANLPTPGLQTPVSAEVPQESTPNEVVTPVSTPAPKKFPRGWCPVCGHEGMRCADGRIKAHQREGAPCEGQQALLAPPTAAALLQAEVASVPEAAPQSTEPNDIGASDYLPVETPVVQADEDAPASDDFEWVIKSGTPPPIDNDVSKHPLKEPFQPLPPPPAPYAYRGEAPIRLSSNGSDRLNAVRQTLRDLDAALPGYYAALEAVQTLRDFGVALDLDAPPKADPCPPASVR